MKTNIPPKTPPRPVLSPYTSSPGYDFYCDPDQKDGSPGFRRYNVHDLLNSKKHIENPELIKRAIKFAGAHNTSDQIIKSTTTAKSSRNKTGMDANTERINEEMKRSREEYEEFKENQMNQNKKIKT